MERLPGSTINSLSGYSPYIAPLGTHHPFMSTNMVAPKVNIQDASQHLTSSNQPAQHQHMQLAQFSTPPFTHYNTMVPLQSERIAIADKEATKKALFTDAECSATSNTNSKPSFCERLLCCLGGHKARELALEAQVQHLHNQIKRLHDDMAVKSAGLTTLSGDNSSNTVPSTHDNLGFSKSEIESMKNDADPSTIPKWLPFITARIAAKCADAHALLSMDSQTYYQAMTDPSWRGLDSHLASFIISVVDGTKPHAKIFYEKAASKGYLNSGYLLVGALSDACNLQTSAEREERDSRLEENQYFKMGMTALEAAQASSQLKLDWSTTAAASAGNISDLISRLIKNFPYELQAEAKAFKRELTTCEITGQPLPWDYDQLSNVLAVGLRSMATNVNDQKLGLNMHASKKLKCNHCGGDHKPFECPQLTPCNTCGEKLCPKAACAQKECHVHGSPPQDYVDKLTENNLARINRRRAAVNKPILSKDQHASMQTNAHQASVQTNAHHQVCLQSLEETLEKLGIPDQEQ